MERAMVDIERVLRRRHKLTPGSANDFSIVDRREFLSTQQEAQQTFTMLLASIAGVSLLVGGIGIMNIMLVSVTERTREIGIRMALGATRFSILLQFLVESVTLCLLGGGLGILLGTVAARTLSRFAGWEVFVSPESVGLASAFSVGSAVAGASAVSPASSVLASVDSPAMPPSLAAAAGSLAAEVVWAVAADASSTVAVPWLAAAVSSMAAAPWPSLAAVTVSSTAVAPWLVAAAVSSTAAAP